MKKLTFISCLLLSGCLAGAMAANKKQPIYKDAKAPIEERVNDLVSRMTLEEKVQQLNQYTLGRNNNENNRGEEVKKIPATLGSLIYFDEDANLRNEAQRKAMEESRLGIPSFSETTRSTHAAMRSSSTSPSPNAQSASEAMVEA